MTTPELSGPVTRATVSIPRPRKSLSEGVVSEASITARLLGLRLLTLDAVVVVAPAELDAASPPLRRPPDTLEGRPSEECSQAVAPASGRSRGRGGGLAAAARLIEESQATLAVTRSRRLSA